MWSARSNPASTSPRRTRRQGCPSYMNVLFPQLVTIGAPGRSASSTSKTAGSSSRSRRTFETASCAAASVSATIAMIASPRKRTRSSASTYSSSGSTPMRPRIVYRLCGTSFQVRARTKPGTRSASDRSTPRIRAWWSGLRTILRWSMPGNVRSPKNWVRPVTWPIPSLRATDWPTTLRSALIVPAPLRSRASPRPRRGRR